MKDQLVPELRFEEFEGEWEQKNARSIFAFSKGKGLSKKDVSDDGSTPCIRYAELYTRYNEVINEVYSFTNINPTELELSKENDVIIPASGEDRHDIAAAACIIKSGIGLSGDINIIRHSQEGPFLAYYLNNAAKSSIAKLAQGTSVVHLYKSQLQELKLNLPTLPEQQKIATFLSLVDRRLAAARRRVEVLEEWKRGVAKSVFSNIDSSAYVSLSGVCKFSRGGTLSKADLVVDGDYPCIHYGELFSKYQAVANVIISSTNSKGGKLIPEGSVVMPTSDVTPVGLATATYIKQSDVYAGGDINILTPNDGIDGTYLSMYLNYDKQSIVKLVTGTTVKHIYISDIKTLKIPFPPLSEQTRIARILTTIDARITAAQKEVAGWEEWKRGLLQKMLV
ncbi:restriction endonuclease subunit S [Neolewinella agarilytica]|uniref:Type I restriction enzyme, S subunit n=1 Tax=Neolewinella agarilytica TaxID=478744 RepID=A0A1H8ZTS3_9BACT|nr:restriction endonuclease subunit S [Neolewinella agarilytica]SEP67158.1 type I restriction enzyme, S subunit [Neolewinella agarilytica]